MFDSDVARAAAIVTASRCEPRVVGSAFRRAAAHPAPAALCAHGVARQSFPSGEKLSHSRISCRAQVKSGPAFVRGALREVWQSIDDDLLLVIDDFRRRL
jgi:hypothetical protein